MKEYLPIKIKLLENGKLPEFKHEGDACCDCYAAEQKFIEDGKRGLVKLGFAIQLPEDYEAVIRPRSGLSKNGIDVAIGTIDSNYRGEVMVNVINNSGSIFTVETGDRICQLAIRKTQFVQFSQVEELDSSERGEKGFGSTGI